MFSWNSDKTSGRGKSLLRYAEEQAARRRSDADPRAKLDQIAFPEVSLLTEAEKHRRARAKRERIDNPLLSELAARPELTESPAPSVPEPMPRQAEPRAARSSELQQAPPHRIIPSVLDEFEKIDANLRARRAGASVPQSGGEADSYDAPSFAAPQTVRQSWPQDTSEWRPLIDPRYVIDAVRSLRGLIVLATVLGTGLGLVQAMSASKLYYSTAEIKVDPRGLKVIDNGVNPDGYLADSFAVVDSQLGIIRSPTVLEKVVEEERLAENSEFNGDRKVGWVDALLGIIGREDADSDKTRAAADYLGEHVFVERGAKTYNINITAASEDADKAAAIANRIVKVYIEEQRRQQSETVQQTSDELAAPLADLKAKVQKAEKLVESYKTENDLIGVDGRMIDDEAILRLNDQLSAAKGLTIAANARAKSAKEVTLKGVVDGAVPEELNSTVLNTLRGQYSVAKQKMDGMATKLGERHPERIQAETELTSIRSSIASELQRVSQAMQTDLKRAIQTEQDLASRLAELKAGKGNQSSARIKLAELQRDLDVKKSVYESYLLRAGQTAEQVGLNTSNIALVAPPRAAQEPMGTSRKLIVLVGLLGGMALGIGLAVLKGILNSLRSQSKARLPAALQPPAPSGPGGGGMFQPRPQRSVADEVRSALASMRAQSSSAAPASEHPAQSPPQAEPAIPDPQRAVWVAQQQPPQRAQMPQPSPVFYPSAPPLALQPVQPMQHWPVQPLAHSTYPQPPVQPGPMMYPHPAYAPPQPAFVPQQYPQAWQPAPQPPQPLPQPAYVQMAAYAPQPHPFAQEAQHPAPAGFPADDPRLTQIQESIEEFRAALTDMASRRRA